jgi:hypothetical protein
MSNFREKHKKIYMKHKTQLVVIFILEQSIYKDSFILLMGPITNIQFSGMILVIK